MLLLLALTFYYFTVLKVDYYKTGLLDLGWSDSSGYFAQAKAMMKDGYPYLNFGYDKLPSMCPLWLSGTDVSLAEDPARSRFHPCPV